MTDDSGRRGMSGKLARFAIVGVANTAIDLAVFWLVFRLSGLPIVSNLVAWCVAVLFSFAVNTAWSFDRAPHKPVSRIFLQFVSMGALISFGVSNAAILLLAGTLGVWPAKLLGVAVAAALNFAVAKWSIEGRLRN